MAKIKHPFHSDHELSLFLRNEEDDSCRGCRQEILGSSYGCRDCDFYLHRICANLPQEIHKTVEIRGHKEHELKLHEQSPYRGSASCDDCGERCEAFLYHCTTATCTYDVCLFCASAEPIVQHKSYKHGLRALLRPAMMLCDACCTKHEGHFYLSLNCRICIHEDCASLPVIIKLQEHPHPLILSYSSPIKSFPGEFSCGICKQKLNKKSWLYHCKPCGFYVHPTCPADRGCEIVDNFAVADEASLMSLPKDEETDHLFLKFVQHLVQGDNNREIELDETELIKKFGYELTLKKSEEEGLSSSKKCIACSFPIPNYPFYTSCSDDVQFHDIFLHQWCAELPSELQHPGHPHKLNLHEERKNLRCSNCQCAAEGFRFQCGECKNYCLDIRCASLPTVIKHKVHEQHPLYLSEHCLGKFQYCVACNRNIDEFSFGCNICNVNLHYTCTLLPLEFEHRYDKHPFILNYHSIKDDEYYCEICEDEIDPKWWFYDCKECRQSVCVRCMWEDKKPFPHIPNWVRTYVYETHPHPLQLVSHAIQLFNFFSDTQVTCDLCHHLILDQLVYGCEFDACQAKRFHRRCMKGYLMTESEESEELEAWFTDELPEDIRSIETNSESDDLETNSESDDLETNSESDDKLH